MERPATWAGRVAMRIPPRSAASEDLAAMVKSR